MNASTDPGHAAGGQVYVFYPRCLCGDPWAVHAPKPKGKRGERGKCSHVPCGCLEFRPDVPKEVTE